MRKESSPLPDISGSLESSSRPPDTSLAYRWNLSIAIPPAEELPSALSSYVYPLPPAEEFLQFIDLIPYPFALNCLMIVHEARLF